MTASHQFLRADLRVRSRRQLVFATDQQLEFLVRTKSWYVTPHSSCAADLSASWWKWLPSSKWTTTRYKSHSRSCWCPDAKSQTTGLRGTTGNPAVIPESAADIIRLRQSCQFSHARAKLHGCVFTGRKLSGERLYLLIQLPYREAKLTAVQIRLVSERKLRRIQRRKYRALRQSWIFELWDQYKAGKRSASILLKACSCLNGQVEMLK